MTHNLINQFRLIEIKLLENQLYNVKDHKHTQNIQMKKWRSLLSFMAATCERESKNYWIIFYAQFLFPKRKKKEWKRKWILTIIRNARDDTEYAKITTAKIVKKFQSKVMLCIWKDWKGILYGLFWRTKWTIWN